MSKKKSGIDALVTTLIKQHGVVDAIRVSREMLSMRLNEKRLDIWTCVLNKLKQIRSLTY